MRTITISSLDETKELGLQLASLVQPGMLITLTGDLGAGKTTFTKSLGKGIGINKVINSPTFNILKIYMEDFPWIARQQSFNSIELLTK